MFEDLFDSNQNRMAKEIGFSQPAVFRVISGQQAPSRRFVRAVAEHPRVSSEFIYRGVGKASRETAGGRPAPQGLPIASCPLPGLPDQHTQLLSGRYLSLDSRHTSSSYILPVPQDSVLVACPSLRISPDDLLIIEADPASLANAGLLVSRLCLIRQSDPISEILFARVKRAAHSTGELRVDFVEPEDGRTDGPGGSHHLRGLIFAEDSDDGTVSLQKRGPGAREKKRKSLPPIPIRDIVGVVVELRRSTV